MSGGPVKLRTLVGGQATDLPVIPVVTAALPSVRIATPTDSTARTLGERFDAKASIGHTPAPDANYAATTTDTQIGFAALTASRIVTLPDVDLYPLGQVLFIADESGQCSESVTITVMVGVGTNDTIAGKPSHTLASPYQGQGFRRGAANLWIFA